MTLRHFSLALLVAIVIFAVITIHSEMRGFTSGNYGRLYSREIAKVPQPAVGAPEIVTEAEPIADRISADPFALAAARREQYLLDEGALPVTMTTYTAPASAVSPATGGRIHIVQSADGVIATQESRNETPKLRGGFTPQ